MAKRLKISESQYSQMLAEGVAIQGETDSTGKADTAKTAQEISNSGVDPKKVKVEFNGTAMQGGGDTSNAPTMMGEHRIVTKKQLQANRLRYLKENSEVLSLNNFLKKIR